MVKNQVRRFRELAGISRQELADAVMVSGETIRRIEEIDDYDPTMRVARRLADYFHTNLDRLFDADAQQKVVV